MVVVDPTLREYPTIDLKQQPLCIVYRNLDVGFEHILD